MEQLSVITSADLIDWGRVKINEDGSGNIFSVACLSEDGIKLAGVVECLGVRIRATILLKTMLKQITTQF